MSIHVTEAGVHVVGLDPLRLNDVLAEAPEPSPGGPGLRAVAANLLYLRQAFPDAVWHDPAGKLVEATAHSAIDSVHSADITDYDRRWPFPMPPLDYQWPIFAAGRRMTNIALAPVATGAGKTFLAANICADKYMRGEIDAVAVVAPKGVHRQWIARALPEVMTKAVSTRMDVWKPGFDLENKRFLGDAAKMRVLAFNVEAFSADSGRATKALKAYLQSSRVALIVDESSRIKTPGRARTKALLKLAPLAAVRMILTGTPITRGVEDLWAQYEFLDPNIIGMSNYYAFRGRYCQLAPAYRGAGAGVVKIVGYRNMEEFVRKIASTTFVVPKEKLNLPDPVFEEIPVELTDDQHRLYKMLKNKLIDDLMEHRIESPANAAVRLIRLQQVLCGRAVAEDDAEGVKAAAIKIPSNRIKRLVEFIEDAPEPYVIWCRFTADILEVADALAAAGRRPVTYYGATTDAAREAAVRDFIRGDATDFISNPAAGGTGLDGLQQAAECAIYYSSSFNREHRWQSQGRTHRLGMRGRAWYGDMVADVAGSVDRMILGSYKKTEDVIRTLMDRPELLRE